MPSDASPAAWMEKLDKSSMNISQQESSNQVKIYTVGDDIELIDTPGLFGFKEQVNAETNEIEKYKDFGGIRLEDDILITENGSRFLGEKRIPITFDEVEAIMNE